jgi:hypothetical protein
VNTNVSATSANSADSVSAFTGSVSPDAGGVSAISAISVSIVNASVNADVPFSVVSILKLPIPNRSRKTSYGENGEKIESKKHAHILLLNIQSAFISR